MIHLVTLVVTQNIEISRQDLVNNMLKKNIRRSMVVTPKELWFSCEKTELF
jgi:hypothetical protein